MFNLEASQNGAPVKLNPNKPLLFDVPTDNKNPNMLVFEAEYTEDGSINWVNPKKMDSYLRTVDIFTLDFYPPKFDNKLNELGYGNTSKRVKDSIFNSFYCKEVLISEEKIEEALATEPKIDDAFVSESNLKEDQRLLIPTNNNEYSSPVSLYLQPTAKYLEQEKELFNTNCKACHKVNKDMVGPALRGVTKRRSEEWLMMFIYNPQQAITSGDEYAVTMYEKYGTVMTSFPTLTVEEKLSILAYTKSIETEQVEVESTQSISCGIEPSQIKTIWSKKYQNTLLATKEFEERLAVLYKTCNADLLQLYISNLDKNLYEIDRMVAIEINDSLKSKFE